MIEESMKSDELRSKIKNLEKDTERWKIEHDKMCRECKIREEKCKKVANETQDSNA